jgi:FlaA1/EpsC-like NDP-sugar epimerase
MAFLYKIKGRKHYYLSLDFFIILLSYLFSYILRFYPDLKRYVHFLSPEYFIIISLSFIPCYYFFNIYRIMWTYSTFYDVYRIIIANLTAFLVYSSTTFFIGIQYSRMIAILSFMFISVGTIFYRIIIRDYFSRMRYGDEETFDILSNDDDKKGKRVLIIGAGEAGRIILSEFRKAGMERTVIGFIDDNKDKISKMFSGKNVFAGIKHINIVVEKHDINEIIIAMPSIKPEKINRIVSNVRSKNHSMPIKTIPPMIELVDNKHLAISLRNISLADLIGREEVKIDTSVIENKFSDQTVLITGAGGSIGAEICKQLLRFKVRKLIAVGRGENSIYNLVKSLDDYVKLMEEKPDIIYKIADVKDYQLMYTIFEEYEPDVVFHAAAHKHVPIMEYNEIEAIQNNVVGTNNILNLSQIFRINEFVLVSTDKAVRPVNIMGATKRFAELLAGYYNQYKGLKTAIVRFGNVLGSRGSVIPLFREQIERGGPVTVTHPDITRYFMSIPEASLLVINAAAYSKGGELYVLDMGKQYKIVDIVKRLIELYGFRPDEDIKIEYTGLRPGEKMYEELFYSNRNLIKTDNRKIFMLDRDSVLLDGHVIEDFIYNQLPNIIKYDQIQIREMLKKLIPDYSYEQVPDDIDSCSRLVN